MATLLELAELNVVFATSDFILGCFMSYLLLISLGEFAVVANLRFVALLDAYLRV